MQEKNTHSQIVFRSNQIKKEEHVFKAKSKKALPNVNYLEKAKVKSFADNRKAENDCGNGQKNKNL